MSHPDEGLIHAWLDGELDADESARLEALVSSDPAWAAAVAEARGLIAASARIVGALDQAPANVIPRTAVPARRPARQWMLRAAAVVVLLGGSAVVLNRTALDSVGVVHIDRPVNARDSVPAAPAAKPKALPSVAHEAKPAPSVAANAPQIDSKSSIIKKELADAKQENTPRNKDVASIAPAAAAAPSQAGELRANAAAAPSARAAPNFAQEQKTTRLPLSCFEQRVPPARGDSANRIIRLAAAALDDSIRLEKLTLRGDTLAAVNGPLIALRVRCPAQ